MSFIGNIQQFFLNNAIKKESRLVKRNVKLFNLDTAKSIGVVYDASSEKEFKRAAGLIRHLQAQDKMVKSVGFVNEKELPHYFPLKIMYDYMTTKDLNWFGKPQSTPVDDFISYDFDILIDMNLSGNPSLHYIVSLSKAKFKIGLYNEDRKDVYDFMLEGITPDKKSLYIKELLHYLEIFNTK